MYGMVNKAVQELIVRRAGAGAWERIRVRAGVEEEVFIGGETYDDALTYRLVAAACEELGLPADEVLEAFGVHWVLHTARENYGHLLEAVGRSFPEFLDNIPRLHDRVALLFPALKPPVFSIRDRSGRSLILEYRSARPGLQPFVGGLIKGLGQLFGTPVRVALVAGRHTGLDHDEFSIAWEEPA